MVKRLSSSSDEGTSKVTRTTEAESASLWGHPNNSRMAKGEAITEGSPFMECDCCYEECEFENTVMCSNGHRCDCCYEECEFENTVMCSNGHRFCFRCIRRRVEEIIYGGLRAHGSLYCMSTYYCSVSIPMSEIRRALPNDMIERYEDRQAQEAIAEAKLEGLVYCPFCNIPYLVDVKCVEVLDCQNPKCLKASCIKCKELSHIPLQCEEVEKMCGTILRRKVEERMSKAVIRECNICHAQLIKMDAGCNRIICRCGNTICYICRQPLSRLNAFDHYCSCYLDDFEIGKSSCKKCNKCKVYENEVEDNEALAAKKEALKELAEKEPKLLDQEIGPPLKRLRQQTPSEEEQGHHMQSPPQHLPLQLFPTHGIVGPPAEFFAHGDQHMQRPPQHLPLQHFPQLFGHAIYIAELVRLHQANIAQLVRLHHQLANMPPEFFRLGDQHENIALPPQLPPHVDFIGRAHHPELPVRHFFGIGDQLENTALPPQLPPHVDFVERADQPQIPLRDFFGLADQLEDNTLPPPLPPQVDSMRNGEQLANMVGVTPPLPPPHFFQHDGQFANMPLHEHDNQFALDVNAAAPHFLPDDDQLAYRIVHPPQFFPQHDQLANIQYQRGDQFADIHLQAQEDFGRKND